ncbi:putative ammonium transporter 3 [Actinia tenebrosa]|uniref:Ammonium transporter n=1 Tax=Actinia tenebrosa TaxID=6105 RepID=A0A6P8ICM7_ACTTE|nr:putative ammonium transporter 3 [Actinia tenebrosa]XP_031563508.1 putative ammonium transporter 3 [Actinia tenebrosa]
MAFNNSSLGAVLNTTNNIIVQSDIEEPIHPDDATWILTSAFIIFTMQSGFGLLEAGMVSKKNETNVMAKNVIDVVYGGLSYWLFGFAFSFGQINSNSFCGLGYFMMDADDDEMSLFAKYFFQLSFATTATTIVSGAMAERVSLKAYMVYSFINTICYCFPAHWLWAKDGWLAKMGAIDIAGCGPVHLVGGVSGLVATMMLKPRIGRFDSEKEEGSGHLRMASPSNVLLGTFMLWWGWLGFNCGSTFGITGGKWKLASRAAVVTINGSIGGGIFSTLYSYALFGNKLLIDVFITGILGGLVGITGICAIVRPGESFIIGFIGGAVACLGLSLMNKLKIDDPVGCIPTHGFAGIWGLLSVALFSEVDNLEKLSTEFGVLKGGRWRLLGVQFLSTAVIIVWTGLTSFILLFVIDKIIGLRVPLCRELEGADKWEHGIMPKIQSSIDDAPEESQINTPN